MSEVAEGRYVLVTYHAYRVKGYDRYDHKVRMSIAVMARSAKEALLATEGEFPEVGYYYNAKQLTPSVYVAVRRED